MVVNRSINNSAQIVECKDCGALATHKQATKMVNSLERHLLAKGHFIWVFKIIAL